MIGLSLSLCVQDILNNDIDINDIEKIIAATKITDERSMEEVLDYYMERYWNNNPKAIGIVHQLWKKVEQPRVSGSKMPVRSAIWVENESEITWRD